MKITGKPWNQKVLFSLWSGLCLFASWSATSVKGQELDPQPMANVEGTPKPKDWSPGTSIGTVLDSQGQVSGSDGRMTAPQDQTKTPYAPSTVLAKVGAPLSCAVESATDMDHWTRDDNDGDSSNNNDYGDDFGDSGDGVNYSWTASGGSFTSGTTSASATWKAPNEPGRYTISCKIDDTPTKVDLPETGNREDTAVTRTVEVCVVDPGSVPVGVTNPNFVTREGAPPAIRTQYGLTELIYGLELVIDITAYFDFDARQWRCKITKAENRHSMWYGLLPGVDEASEAAATEENYCQMISNLNRLGFKGQPPVDVAWYMESAVLAHELVHVGEIKAAVWRAFDPAKAIIEKLSVDHECGMTADDAKKKIMALSAYNTTVETAARQIRREYNDPDYQEPNYWTNAAEHGIVDPVIDRIRAKAARLGWKPCQ